MKLPEGFFIGAATAAHQVEGNNTKSDCWAEEHLTHTSYAEPSGDAVDHYNRYAEDIALLAEAGLNAYRFSIEWARIEPEEGRFDPAEIAHYREVIECCRSHGVKPIVTLHHFSSPAWLITLGGWKSERTPELFARYAAHVARELLEGVEYVCTINEANMGFQIQKVMEDMMKASAREGAVQVGISTDMEAIMAGAVEQASAFGVEPGKVNTFVSPRTAAEEELVMRAHRAAVSAIKAVRPEIKCGLTLSLFDYQPLPGGEEQNNRLWQEDFGNYLPYIEQDDFLGVQNYSRKRVDASGALEPADGAPLTQMGYEDYPASIAGVLRRVAKHFRGELVVTENGIATSDDARRCEFLREAVAGVAACAAEGIPVKGYCCWSLLDNFEWQLGFSRTFGLIAVDRATQTRHPKESLSVLGSLAKS